MILSESSSAICLIHGESNCGTSDCLRLARFRMRTLICSPPLLGGLGSAETSESASVHVSIMSLWQGLPLWLPHADHDAHDFKAQEEPCLPWCLESGHREDIYWPTAMQAKPHWSTVLAVNVYRKTTRSTGMGSAQIWNCRKATDKAQIPHMWREYALYL